MRTLPFSHFVCMCVCVCVHFWITGLILKVLKKTTLTSYFIPGRRPAFGMKGKSTKQLSKVEPQPNTHYITAPNSFHSPHIPLIFLQIKSVDPPSSLPPSSFLTSSAPHAVQMLAPGCAHASVNALPESSLSLLLRRIQ